LIETAIIDAMETLRGRLEERFWDRHSDPKSGWRRTLTLPALLAAINHRRFSALVGVVDTILNYCCSRHRTSMEHE
jgi:hypothetical protein